MQIRKYQEQQKCTTTKVNTKVHTNNSKEAVRQWCVYGNIQNMNRMCVCTFFWLVLVRPASSIFSASFRVECCRVVYFMAVAKTVGCCCRAGSVKCLGLRLKFKYQLDCYFYEWLY